MGKQVLDWMEYQATARELVAEGCVLLENKENALPLRKGETVSVFGRIQTNYYKSGTGSGGMVNVSHVVNVLEGLRNSNHVILNEDLLRVYEKWEEENPFDEGCGWGTEPWSQIEMPLTDEILQNARACSETAIVIIGRTAGEDKDIQDIPGAYRLSELEEKMLSQVRSYFPRMIVLLNIGSMMDLNYFDVCQPDALLCIWQGGMQGGDGTADVLTGRVSPSGKLTGTVAYHLEDHPSHLYFGNKIRNRYTEDIYVGYRYFETFAKEKVRYPFGYGLSYTTFSYEGSSVKTDKEAGRLYVNTTVKNVGQVPGKEAVQVYVSAPQGNLGKPSVVLVSFAKTKELAPGETQSINMEVPFHTFASYDDTGVTGKESCFVLEAGRYDVYVGKNVRDAEAAGNFELASLYVTEELNKALRPVLPMKRMVPLQKEDGSFEVDLAEVPVSDIDEARRREADLPPEIPRDFTKKITLEDVVKGTATVEELVGCLTDEDMACLVRGEGMGSALVTPGTASAFGGVSEHLRELGIPCVCCDDGPSGMRLDSGVKAFSLPCGTLIASSFNEELTERLYTFTSLEMVANKVECLLGPGMNIHRHPLNGRNFEYFSEDPYMTGKMAGACLRGIQKYGVSGTVKHFCANNQEYGRLEVDAVVSERALREIYLKGFEMVVKNKEADSIMTTYGAVNGLWTAGNYDLNTTILRKQWGYDGIVMTDWWAKMNDRGEEPRKTNYAAMIRAQNDLYMVCADSSKNADGDNTLSALEDGSLTRGELQRCAVNIIRFAMNSQAMKRQMGTADEIEIINRNDESDLADAASAEYRILDGEITIPLNDKESKAGTDYIIPLDIRNIGIYDITVSAKSSMSELAQMTCTLFYTGVPFLTYAYHGTEGKTVSITKELYCHNRFGLFRLNVASNGLELESITFRLKEVTSENPMKKK